MLPQGKENISGNFAVRRFGREAIIPLPRPVTRREPEDRA